MQWLTCSLYIYTCTKVIQTSRVFRVEMDSGWSQARMKLDRAFFNYLNYLIKCIEMYHIISIYIFISLLVLF